MAWKGIGKMKNVTHSEIKRSQLGSKKGWHFTVHFNNSDTASIVSALYKTKKETTEKLHRYLVTGKLETYGSAE